MDNIVNKVYFNLYKRVKSTYSLISSGMSLATTFIFRNINMKINLNFVTTMLAKSTLILNARKIKLTVVGKLTGKQTQTINAQRPKLTITIKERLKAVTSISTRPITLTAIARSIWNFTQSFKVSKITMSADPVVASFFSLLEYDPDTLSALDSLTLGEMDYVEV